MTSAPATGHDGPYDAPLALPGERVRPDWIDYNGHMNVAYYLLAFDHACDRMLEDHLGVGESFVAAARMGPYALQSSIHYLAELLEGEAFDFTALLLDCDAKRMHLMLEMRRAKDREVAATYEVLLMNVDLRERRSAPYPDWAQARMARMKEAHACIPRPPQCGKPLGIRRKG